MPIQRKRILYVDDQKDTCELIKMMLGLEGYEVTVATNVDEFFAFADQERFDLFILDYHFPEMKGDSICALLHFAHPQTPVISFTADAREAVREAAMRAGARAHLVKPDDIGNLVGVVSQLIEDK